MNFIDNLKNSLRKWLKIDDQIRSKCATNINDTTIYDEYALYNAWAISDSHILENVYKQLPVSYKYTFWKAVPDKPLPKKTAGIAKSILDVLINIISENYDDIIFDNEDEKIKNIWDSIDNDNNFYSIIIKAVRDALVFGEGAFKILYLPEISQYPIINFVGAQKCEIKYMYNRVTEIIFYDITYTDAKDKQYTLHEIYKPGSITYKLIDEYEKEVPLDTIPETANLQDIYFSDGHYMAAVPFKIMNSDKYENHGVSIYAGGKTDLLDMLDETLSQYNLTVRLSAPKQIVKEDYFEYDNASGKYNINSTVFNPLYVSASTNAFEEENGIQVIQNALNSEEYGKTISQLITLICSDLISPASLALSLNDSNYYNNESGESQREKEKQTLYTINKIKNSICDTIPIVVERTLLLYNMISGTNYNISSQDISVKIDEYANPSFEAKIETLKKAAPELTIVTPEEIVSEKYGYTITDEQKEEYIKNLYIINYGVESIEELLNSKKEVINVNATD